MIFSLPSPILVQEGGETPVEEILFTFSLSVVASVVAYYICKWFDKDEKR